MCLCYLFSAIVATVIVATENNTINKQEKLHDT